MDKTIIRRPFPLIMVTTNFIFNPFGHNIQQNLLLSNTVSSVHAFTAAYQPHHRNSLITDHFTPFLVPPLSSLRTDKNDVFGDDDDDDDLRERISPEEVNYGKYMDTNFDLEKILDTDEIVAEASEIIEETIEKRRQELIALKESVGQEYEKSKAKRKYESKIRAEAEAKRFAEGMDRLAEDFLDSTRIEREGTKMAARADSGMKGKGLELGSWGKVGRFDVLTESKDDGDRGIFLGSVAAADERIRTGAARRMEQDGEEVKELDSKILIVFDGKKDAKMQRVLDCFTTLISTSPLPATTTSTYTPTAILPMGGDGAQTLIIVSSSLSNGRSSAESMLARLLKRSLPTGGGAILPPPSHLIVLSSVGSSRTDKFPYSMQNLVGGGKLSKMYEVEECVVSTVKGRMVSDGVGGVPSDYTVMKFGEIVEDSEVAKKNKGNLESESHDHSVTIRPGDSLDGAVGIEAAANVLLQAVALQPNARNATMSVIGGMTTADGGNVMWEDGFLRLDGPELWRIEGKNLWSNSNKGDADRAFNTITTYLEEWSKIFENDAKGTGLTTPVTVVPPKLKVLQGGDENVPSPAVRARWSLRLEFKSTRTGSAYKSKSEEKQAERERNNISTPRASTSTNKEPAIKNTKASKEGGVEILVEKTAGKDGLMSIRVRARRCNMSDFTVVKEISEETIVKRVQEAVAAWKKNL